MRRLELNRHDELHELMVRYCRIGCLLDTVDEDAMRDGDKAAIANAKIIINEMAKVKSQIDAFLGLDRRSHS